MRWHQDRTLDACCRVPFGRRASLDGRLSLASDTSYREQLPALLESVESWVAGTRAALESGGPILPIRRLSIRWLRRHRRPPYPTG